MKYFSNYSSIFNKSSEISEPFCLLHFQGEHSENIFCFTIVTVGSLRDNHQQLLFTCKFALACEREVAGFNLFQFLLFRNNYFVK